MTGVQTCALPICLSEAVPGDLFSGTVSPEVWWTSGTQLTGEGKTTWTGLCSVRIEEYVANALAPAEVISVTMTGERACRVRVAPDQLSLAIGKEGQNARLAARLTGCKIDIKSSDYED